MSLAVAIFEDDKDVADLLKEMMESHDFVVTNYYSLHDRAWMSADVVLGDYRNKIVSFQKLFEECEKHNVPLIAISGAETQYRPQLIKPFSLEELQATILETMMKANKKPESKGHNPPTQKKSGLFSFFKKSG
jgi:DNA-binding NtrC family response regulator